MGYSVARVSTAAVADRLELFAGNSGITAVHVLQVPAGVVVELAIGTRPTFPTFAGFSAQMCPAETGPIVAKIVTNAPGEMVVLGWTDGASSTGPA